MTLLKTYNAVGLVTVTRTSVTIRFMAIDNEKKHPTRRTFKDKDVRLNNIEPRKAYQASFGAWLEPNKEPIFEFYEHEKQEPGNGVMDIPAVNEIFLNFCKNASSNIFGPNKENTIS